MELLRRWIKVLLQDASWRLAILLLPWQVRWFSEGPLVNGYPWEQGRISMYASWIPMLATIFCVFFNKGSLQEVNNEKPEEMTTRPSSKFLFFVGLILFLIPSFFTISLRATIQWWMQWVILIGFVWSLVRLRISFRSLVRWFIISLVPHLFLGIQQYLTQFVHGSKWLGMATQNPLDRGVSVIQVGDQRILRAYGGFPHPNIFGAWVVAGMMAGLWFWNEAKKYQRYALAIFFALSSIALVLTFSRSAWMACVVGIIAFLSIILAHARSQLKRNIFPFFIILLFLGSTAFFVREKIFVRLQPTQTRLEAKSVDERQEAMKSGWVLFKQHPWKGTGPGTTILAFSQLPSNNPMAPAVPPHLVLLMILDELGLLGVIGFSFVVLSFHRRHFFSTVDFLSLVFLLPFLFLDHFLWSVWSGQILSLVSLCSLLMTYFNSSDT